MKRAVAGVGLVAALVAVPSARAQTPDPGIARLSLAQHAKRYCSAIWVSGREREEALQNTVLITAEGRADFQSRAMRFAIDDPKRIVTATKGAASARARFFGDQGCVILPDATDQVFFTPRPVRSALPDAASTAWPMGDKLPDGPPPAGVNRALLAQASSPCPRTAAPRSWWCTKDGSWPSDTARARTRTCSSRAGRWGRA
jgi:hypothetical protein